MDICRDGTRIHPSQGGRLETDKSRSFQSGFARFPQTASCCYFFRQFAQYSEGVMPVCLLNILLKCCGYSQPSIYATCATPAPDASSFFARWMTYRRI